MMKFDEHIKRNTITLPNLDSEGVYEIPPEPQGEIAIYMNIYDRGFVKFGKTKNHRKRMAQYISAAAHASFWQLVFDNHVAVDEDKILNHYQKYKIDVGNEWFHLPREEVEKLLEHNGIKMITKSGKCVVAPHGVYSPTKTEEQSDWDHELSYEEENILKDTLFIGEYIDKESEDWDFLLKMKLEMLFLNLKHKRPNLYSKLKEAMV